MGDDVLTPCPEPVKLPSGYLHQSTWGISSDGRACPCKAEVTGSNPGILHLQYQSVVAAFLLHLSGERFPVRLCGIALQAVPLIAPTLYYYLLP